MAIAYFIPDQAKLLRRHGDGSNDQNNNNNHSNNNSNSSSSSASSDGNPQQPTTATNSSSSGSGNNFHANITIPLNPFAPRHASNVGCWELITQVFCYALRFYNESTSSASASGSSGSGSSGGGGTTANSRNHGGSANMPLIHITVEIRGVNSGSESGNPSADSEQQPPTQATPRRKN